MSEKKDRKNSLSKKRTSVIITILIALILFIATGCEKKSEISLNAKTTDKGTEKYKEFNYSEMEQAKNIVKEHVENSEEYKSHGSYLSIGTESKGDCYDCLKFPVSYSYDAGSIRKRESMEGYLSIENMQVKSVSLSKKSQIVISMDECIRSGGIIQDSDSSCLEGEKNIGETGFGVPVQFCCVEENVISFQEAVEQAKDSSCAKKGDFTEEGKYDTKTGIWKIYINASAEKGCRHYCLISPEGDAKLETYCISSSEPND